MLNPSHQGAQMGRQAPVSQHYNGPGQQSAANALTSFVTYAKAMQDLDEKSFPVEYEAHRDRLLKLEPMLRVHGILDVMEIRNPEIKALLRIP
ncbi:hypothetical protein [Nocardia sp. NPDC050413]|uniref:hypothetical protein n=1 Tax=Nocardia sp. NPDC050413 TaxID=3155784 RepID=UPI0033DC58E1